MKLANAEILADLYACLNGNLATGSVYDEAPQDSSFPYVLIGEMQTTRHGSKTTDGQDVTVTFHVWSAYKGDKQVHQMMDDVVQLITAYTWSLTGFDVLQTRHEFDTVIEDRSDADRPLRHGILRVRLLTHEQ